MRSFTVQYETDAEISSFPFEAMTLHQAGERALAILFLNDCCPGEDWRILDSAGDTIPYQELSLDPNSTAAYYYHRANQHW